MAQADRAHPRLSSFLGSNVGTTQWMGLSKVETSRPASHVHRWGVHNTLPQPQHPRLGPLECAPVPAGPGQELRSLGGMRGAPALWGQRGPLEGLQREPLGREAVGPESQPSHCYTGTLCERLSLPRLGCRAGRPSETQGVSQMQLQPGGSKGTC